MRNIIFLLAMSVFFISCGTQKKMAATRKTLAELIEQQDREEARLRTISAISVAKLNEGKIDYNIDTLMRNKLGGYTQRLQSFQQEIDSIDSLLSSRKIFRRKYKSHVLPMLDSLKEKNAKHAERMKLYVMLEDGLDIANYQLFDLAAFFGPGKYTIPEDKVELTLRSFAPIVDSVIHFSTRFKDVPRTGTLIILGFADGTGFANEGALVDTLKKLTGRPEASKEELNIILSELRAKELVSQLTKIFAEKAPLFNNYKNIRIEYVAQGRGEALPLPYIKDYTADDPRRRIVLCYWTVLPD